VSTNSFTRQTDASQNKVQSFAFCLALSVAGGVSLCFAVSSLGRLGQPCEIRLESRVNPNYVPPASLARLPGIGLVRAEAIIAYRKNFRDNEARPFKDCNDLQKVKGIGPKTAADICEWLKFEQE
jgi:competence ComEA-like helix-hairpin-helix protein